MEVTDAEPDASANAGSAPWFQSSVSGPAWLRFAFGVMPYEHPPQPEAAVFPSAHP
jgi:hypothetical protein